MVKIWQKTKLVIVLIYLSNCISSSHFWSTRESVDWLILSHLFSNNAIICKTPLRL